MMKHHALALLLAAGLTSVAYAGVIDRAQEAAATQSWSAWGGQIGFHWNTDLLGNMGITMSAPNQVVSAPKSGTHADFRPHTWFDLRQSGGLAFNVVNDSLKNFDGGSLTMRGGFTMRLPDGSSIDLRDLSLRVRAGNSQVLDVVSGDGNVWFYSDRVMFELADNNRTLAVRAADLRISKALADRIGDPAAAGWEVADMAMNTEVYVQGSNPQPNEVCDPYPWPNVSVPNDPGQIYEGDLFMQSFSVSPVGCQSCTGPGGSEGGLAALAPSSTLRNNVNDGSLEQTISGDPLGTSDALHTGFIAWFTMFSGTNPPYNNDQHPYLIWNMYRVDADGSIHQIGRSGVKHAFLTINSGCLDSCNHYGSHALGRGCGDTYGVGNNDSQGDMGPRSEIVPATGVWGRCGSIWDPSCTGSEHSNGNNSWTQRMKVPEKAIDPSRHAGATYMFESWYVARDDVNIYNSMATVTGTPAWTGGNWTFSGATNYKLGPAIDRWVNPTSPPANSMNTELATDEGHVKVAVKVSSAPGGKWRYDYAVMNLDFARAETTGSAPNVQVISNHGFDSFSVPFASGAKIYGASASVGDPNPNMNWHALVGDGNVTWSTSMSGLGIGASGWPMPTALPPLDWGTMYTFSFVSDRAPVAGNSTLHVMRSGSPASYDVATLVPSGSPGSIRVGVGR